MTAGTKWSTNQFLESMVPSTTGLLVGLTLHSLYPYGSLIKAIAKQIAKEETVPAYALKTLQRYTLGRVFESSLRRLTLAGA